MDVQFLGTGGPAGWPQAGCRCASCLHAAAAGLRRRPGGVLVDGRLRIDLGQPPRPADPGGGQDLRAGYRIKALAGGWDITGPEGARLLVAASPGAVPDPPAGTAPYDLVLLDLLGSATQLGDLRARGVAGADTVAAALCADHRISTEQELARRCRHWRALVPADGTILGTDEPGPGDTAVIAHRTLVLGGGRSGKSREAELRLAAEPQVTYLAADPWPDSARAGRPSDVEWEQRVAAHQARRPTWWTTVESADIAGGLRRLRGAVLIDGIGTWLAAAMTESGAWQEPAAAQASDRIAARVDELIAAWRQASARVVAVSDEVGSGVVPATRAGRQFRDQLGWLNQRLAAESEETVLVVAGQVLSLPS